MADTEVSEALQAELTYDECKRLFDCSSDDEWNEICRSIKEVRGGRYPDNWYTAMVQSGMMEFILKRFNSAYIKK